MNQIADVYTVPDLLVRAVNRAGDDKAILFPDLDITYSELYGRAVMSARSLAALGIGKGDHVGILMSNCQEFVDIFLGSQLLGAWPVPINARYKARELNYVIKNADIKILFTTDRSGEHVDFVALLDEAFPNLAGQEDATALNMDDAPLLKNIVLFGERSPTGMMGQESFEEMASATTEAAVELSRSRIATRDIAMMMYTSGTTAMPKGCPISHEALVRPALEAGRTRFFLGRDDRMWDPLPMFHMSFVLPLLACMDAGAALLTMEYFEPGLAIEYMEREKATVNFASFPTITEALLNHPNYDPDKLKIRLVNNVGPAKMLASMQERMPNATQISAYGMTECGGVSCFGDVDDSLEKRTQTSGKPFRGIEVQIRDIETDEILGPDQSGEILVRGYCLFEGYYKDPEKNELAFTEDGWFRTGDICSLDEEGRVTYKSRLKDMLKVGGENVAAAEIEGLLSGHPEVVLAQVVSAPDEKYMEVPAAYIQLAEGADLSEDQITEYCKGKIASFKIPHHVRFITEWPMSATKIQKVRLREMIAEELET